MAVILSLPLCTVGALAVSSNHLSNLVAHGPIQQGHSGIDCMDCHKPSVGTVRQQLQAKLAYTLNKRTNPVDFGYQPVISKFCLECHQRPNERHPVYRFNEPRFSNARNDLHANSCLGCHSEHRYQRVSVDINFCSHCHEKLSIKNDPIDIPHSSLASDAAWDTCLGCHDFHGNHEHKPETIVSKRISHSRIQTYFADGEDPYGTTRIYNAITNE